MCSLAVASFGRTINIPADMFGSGVSFDEIDIFVENVGLQFDASALVAFDPGGFAGWLFSLETGTYAVGRGPETFESSTLN